MFFVGLFLLIFQIRTGIVANYNMEKNYLQLWQLADKSSTISAKQEYMAKFVTALEDGYTKGDFAQNDAIWLKTPNNSFEANLTALKTLSARLKEIQGLNPNSFEYNTAIQQITAQEQGEAKAMIGVFTRCYDLGSYPIVWGWIEVIVGIFALILFLSFPSIWFFRYLE